MSTIANVLACSCVLAVASTEKRMSGSTCNKNCHCGKQCNDDTNCKCCPCPVISTNTATASSATEPTGDTSGWNTTTASSSTADNTTHSVTKTSSVTIAQSSPNISTSAQVESSYDTQAVAVAVSVMLAVVVVAVVVVVVVWWRRKRAFKSRGGVENAHTNMRVSVTDGPSHTNKEYQVSTQMKDSPNRAVVRNANRNSEHVYTYVDSDINLSPKSTVEGAEDSTYNEPDDVTNRKLPTAPAQIRPYSLSQNPSAEHGRGQRHSAVLPSVYSLAHNLNEETTNTPQYFILEEERNVSYQNKADGGQYFILEDGSATEESGNKFAIPAQNGVEIHDAHEYAALDSLAGAQKSDQGDADYTPLHGKTGPRPKIPAKIHGEHEFFDLDPSNRTRKPAGCGEEYTALQNSSNPLAHADTGTVNRTGGRMHKRVKGKNTQTFPPQPSDGQNKDGQYFTLEKEGENDHKGDASGGQYFVLENDGATDDQEDETRGQYFVLEEDTADTEDTDQKQNGQYFFLEKEATTDEDKEAKVGQYFILGKNVASASEAEQDSHYFENTKPRVHAATGTTNDTGGYIHKGVKENETTTGGQGRTERNHPSATAADEDYSHLDRSGKGGKSGKKVDPDKDYTHLDVTHNGDSNEEEARNAREYFEFEPEM